MADGIDDVLAQAQPLTADRYVDLNENQLQILSGGGTGLQISGDPLGPGVNLTSFSPDGGGNKGGFAGNTSPTDENAFVIASFNDDEKKAVIHAHADENGSSLTFGGTIILDNSYTPSSSTSTGVKGQIAWDAYFIYVCVDDNLWTRASISAW